VSDALLVAILGVAAAGLTGWIAWLTRRLVGFERENRALWLWARELVDFAYRHNPNNDPIPEPPAFLTPKD